LAKRTAAIGDRLRDAGVAAVYLIHGTFVGADALGMLRGIARVWPAAGEVLRNLQKQTVDAIARNAGNFTADYARQLQDGLQGDHPHPIPVKLFHWSGENHHIGRADGAIRLLDDLATRFHSTSDQLDGHFAPGDRILIWGHSHGGSLLALLTNLLANDVATNEHFFAAARPYFRWPGTSRVDFPVWPRVAKMLADAGHPFRSAKLDIVTMGTPIRYGWDTEGCAKLLHFVNHRCDPEGPEYLAKFPGTADEIVQATAGDVIQQFGVAGTNFAPPLWAWRAVLADNALGSLLQAGIRKRDVLERLKMGCRVHTDGTTLLVDYGPSGGNIAQHLAGHAVYTSRDWQLFHLEQIARYFYGLEMSPQPPAEPAA